MRRAGFATLGVPLRDALPAWIAATIVLSFYAATASRDLSAFDSAELALAAYQGGLAHPPGHVLHTLLGWLATRALPSPLSVLSLLSIIPAALAALPVISVAEAMAPLSRAREARWLGAAAFVGVSMHAAVWEPATRVEVYTLAGFLCLLSFSWVAEIRARPESSWRPFVIVGGTLGLATGANAALAVVSSIACLVALLPVARAIGARRAVCALGGAVVGASINLYVLVAPIDPRAFTWGKPRSPEALLAFVSGADYAHNAGVTAGEVMAHLVALLADHASRFVVPIVVIGLASHVALGRSGIGRVAPLLVAVAAWLGVAANRIFVIGIPDYDGYTWTAVMLATAGVAAVARNGLGSYRRSRIVGWAVVGVVVASSALAVPRPWARTRASDGALRSHAEAVLRDTPRRAVLLLAADHVAAPVLWLHEAERVRPDVVVLPVGLSSSSWYWEHLHIRHPDLRAFALSGAGARRGRVTRLLRANPDRIAVTDQAGSVAELGWDECVADLGAVARLAPCGATTEIGTRQAALRDARVLARWIDRLSDGSPSSDEAIGQVAYARGIRAWRAGHAAVAMAFLVAPMSREERAAFRGVHVDETPPLAVVPSVPQTRPIFDRAAARAAACAMIGMSGQREPDICRTVSERGR